MTHDAVIQWDIRMFKATAVQKEYLAFTKLAVAKDVIATGNQLGIIRLSSIGKDTKNGKIYEEYSAV